MGAKLNVLKVILVILFITGIIISAFFLYNLPDSLLKETSVIAIHEITKVLPVLAKVNVAVGGTLFLGLTVIVMLLFSRSNDYTSKMVFADNRKDQKKDTTEETSESHDNEVEVKEFESLFSTKDSLEDLSTKILTALCKEVEASQGALYFTKKTKDQRVLELKGSYAYGLADSQAVTYEFGEGLVGQAAKTGNTAHIKDVPEGYIEIFSGLGHSKPGELLLLPLKNEKEVVAVAEIATFKPFSKKDIKLAEKVFSLFSAHLSKSKTSKAVEKEDKIS